MDTLTPAEINDLRGSAQYSLSFSGGADLAIAPGKLLALLDAYDGSARLENDLSELREELADTKLEITEKDQEIAALEEECGDLTRELEGGVRAD